MLNADKIRELPGKASFLIFALPFLYMCVVVLSHGIPDLPNSGDGALLELSTRNLFSRGILLGPYSRFYFFHPGPLYFFLRFPLYMISGFSNCSFLITTCLISLGSVLGAWHIVRKGLGNTAALLFSIIMALFLLKSDKTIWFSEWNPFVIMFPVLLFGVSTAALAARSRNVFWMIVLSGSFVAQTHLGGIPALAVVFLIGILSVVYQWTVSSGRRSSPPIVWKQFAVGGALLLVLWMPPLYEQLSADGKGNMTKIQEFFEDEDPEIEHSEAFTAWSNTLSRFELSDYAPQLRRSDPTGKAALIVVAVRLLLLSVVYSLLRRRGDQPFMSALILICIGMHGVTWYSVSQIRGELNGYLIEWMSIIAPLSGFAILFSFLILCRDKLKNRIKFKPVYISFTLLAALAVISLQTVNGARGYFRTELDPSWGNEIAVRELSDQLAIALERNGNDFYVLNLQSQETWPVLFGVLNQLEKQGYPIGVLDNFMYGEVSSPSGMNPRALYIGILNGEQTEVPGLVASFNSIGLVLQ